MKVCLISAPTANDFDDPTIAESEAVRLIAEHAPLGILSLAAVLEREGVEAEIVDLNRAYYDYLRSEEYKRNEADFPAYIGALFAAREPFNFYGFSSICSSYPLTLRIAAEVKRLHPDSSVALGGPQASVVDVATMRAFPYIDLVVRGEAERTLPAVLDALDANRSPTAIPGVTCRVGKEIRRGENAPVILNLDELPFPAYHLYPHIEACSYVPLELGRGCPFACTFCSTNDFFRRRFRLKSPAHVLDEMRRIKNEYGVANFDLVHDMFTVDRKRVVAFCQTLIDSGEKFNWGCSARTDCIDDELIELMAQAGCAGIFYGIETGSERLQRVIEKDLDLRVAAERIQTCDKFRIKTAVSLITGFPEETTEDLRDTCAFFMDSLRYDYADPQLCVLAPLAETPIHRQHEAELVFDDVISDMSFQGWRQDPADREMIERHRDIFPNFYSVPTPHLDRQAIKELREFLLSGMQVFRWLLIGLHQDSGDLLNVFEQWQQWRATNKLPFPEDNARIYYAQPEFRREFIEFVNKEYIPARSKAPELIATLADYESSMCSQPDGATQESCYSDVNSEELISLDSCPRTVSSIRVTELNADYYDVVKQLRDRQLAEVQKRKVTLVTHLTPNKGTEVLQLSTHSAGLLVLCDGRSTVRGIAARLAEYGLQVPGIPDEQTSLFGIEILRRQGLVELTELTAAVRESAERVLALN